MKKALILTGFDPAVTSGGIETFTRELLLMLESLGIGADVVAASGFGNDYGLSNEFIGRVYTCGRNISLMSPDEYELVISNGYYGGGYIRKHIKTTVVFHSTHAGYAEAIKDFVPLSTYLEIRHVIGGLLERTSASGAKVAAVSGNVRAELLEHYGIKDADVVPNPVDTGYFRKLGDTDGLRKKYGISAGVKVGLYVGRWETSKGKDITERLMEEMRDIFWVIAASSGGEKDPPERRGILSLSDVDREVMRDLYSLSDFMIFPSRYEGFGLAPLEAMSCGLPVIASPVGFLSGVYSSGPFSPLSIPIRLPDLNRVVSSAITSAERLLADRALWSDVSLAGRKMAEENFDIGHWRQRMTKTLCLN